jgi:formate dehydrogenase assembly factor FdhD
MLSHFSPTGRGASIADFVLPCGISTRTQEAQLREELKVLHAENEALQTKYDVIVARAEKAEQVADQYEQARSLHVANALHLLGHA